MKLRGLRGLPLAKRLSGIILLVTLAVMLLHSTGLAVYLLEDPTTSFPWYSAYFFVPLLGGYAVSVPVLLLLYCVLCIMSYRKSKKEGSND